MGPARNWFRMWGLGGSDAGQGLKGDPGTDEKESHVPSNPEWYLEVVHEPHRLAQGQLNNQVDLHLYLQALGADVGMKHVQEQKPAPEMIRE